MTATGEPYLNNETHWGYLCKAAAWARVLGLVDAERFADRRNDDAVVNAFAWPGDYEPWVSLPVGWEESAHWQVPESSFEWRWALPRLDFFNPLRKDETGWQVPQIPGIVTGGYDYQPADQPVLVEVWAEKSTQNDILAPLCRSLGVNLLTGAGYESYTRIIEALRRGARYPARHVHFLYVSDYDKAGRNMPFQVSRNLQFWARKYGIDVAVTVERVTLTREQVESYELPQAPNTNAVELDALEAFFPGELACLVTEAVQRQRDDDIEDDLADAGEQAQHAAEEQWSELTADLAAEAADLAAAVEDAVGRRDRAVHGLMEEIGARVDAFRPQLRELTREVRDLVEDRRPQIEAIAAELDEPRRRLAELEGEVTGLFQDAEFSLPARPAAPDPEVADELLLYDSRRHWADQLVVFKEARKQEEPCAGTNGQA